MKVLSSQAHGALDYLLIIFLAMAPIAAELTGPYALACYGLAAAYLIVVLATDFPMGLGHFLTYRAHGRMELVSGVAFIAAPYLFGFSAINPTARLFFMAFGSALLLLWLFTDWSGRVHSEMSGDTAHNLKGESVSPTAEKTRRTPTT